MLNKTILRYENIKPYNENDVTIMMLNYFYIIEFESPFIFKVETNFHVFLDKNNLMG